MRWLGVFCLPVRLLRHVDMGHAGAGCQVEVRCMGGACARSPLCHDDIRPVVLLVMQVAAGEPAAHELCGHGRRALRTQRV